MYETTEQRVRRKAEQIRSALIKANVVYSPDPDMKFEDLPANRQRPWLNVAATYVENF
jgi:hypothetical protein